MTYSYVWHGHGTSISATWLFHDMTHLHLRRDSVLQEQAPQYITHDVFICVTWRIRDMAHPHLRHDSVSQEQAPRHLTHDLCACATWLIHGMTPDSVSREQEPQQHLYVWHGSWVIHVCDISSRKTQFSNKNQGLQRWFVSFVTNEFCGCVHCVTWIMSHSFVWHYSTLLISQVLTFGKDGNSWFIHMCDMTQVYLWHDSCIRLWHDSSTCINIWEGQQSWRIHLCDMTYT